MIPLTLSRYGLREWLTASIAAAALLTAIYLWGAWWMALPVGLIWFAFAAFFRDPLGRQPQSPHARDLVSPADGRISAIEHVDSHEAIGGPAIIVRIFLSVLNVHINRMPCQCQVVHVEHRPGRYLDARTTESAKVNEANLLSLRTDWGEPLGVKQISGAIARRIVCQAQPGERFHRGQRFGMIKFGSTTELIVPSRADMKVAVKVGDAVVGGVTILVHA